MDADSEDPDNTDCEFPKEFGFDPNYELKLAQAWIETDIVFNEPNQTNFHTIVYLAHCKLICNLDK